MFDPQDLADRYLEIFNEGDNDARAKMIADFWALDGEHHGGFDGKGHAEIEAGITKSHANWIDGRGWKWVPKTPAKVRQNVVFFMFDAALAADETQIVADGAQVLIVNEEGKVEKDYTFVMTPPPPL